MLTFDALRVANLARLPQFKNRLGALAHRDPLGRDWSPAQWLQAVVGELGEYANLRKKYERGDLTLEEFRVEAANELADVQTYLDILAFQIGVELGQATADKFNAVSRRVGCQVRLAPERGRIVPRELSPEMLEAGAIELNNERGPRIADDVDRIWRAILAAAPTDPTVHQEGDPVFEKTAFA